MNHHQFAVKSKVKLWVAISLLLEARSALRLQLTPSTIQRRLPHTPSAIQRRLRARLAA